MTGQEPEMLLLARDSQSTRVLQNFLREKIGTFPVILESPISKSRLVRRRIQRLGPIRVMGQLLFQIAVMPRLKTAGAKRIREILDKEKLSDAAPSCNVINVPSVNDDETIKHICHLKPRLIIINGTRIISKRVLEMAGCPFFNIHAGITPLYRGVHGAYWALVEGRKNLAGVTVHFVDPGIDTGRVIAQKTIAPEAKDNFMTYPMLQLAAGLPLLLEAVSSYLRGSLALSDEPQLPSKLRYHPTIWEYAWYRFTRGVK